MEERMRPDELPDDMPRMLSRSEVAKRLGVHVNTVYRWARKGYLRPVRMPSGHLRYSERDIERFQQALAKQAEYPYEPLEEWPVKKKS